MGRMLELDHIVLIGRTFDEYRAMFNLDDLTGDKPKILDAASGVSSFCAEASEMGLDVTGTDVIYGFDSDEIAVKCKADLETVTQKIRHVQQSFKWEYFKDIEELRKERTRAYSAFINDFQRHKGQRYVFGELPNSIFNDNEFTHVLSSHFLFMYDEFFDYEFHKAVLQEFIRIASKEIRIFPIINLSCEKSTFVERLLKDKDFTGISFEIRQSGYEFAKGGNEMLVIRIP